MSRIAENLVTVRARIAQACASCGRPADDVSLLAVSKGQPAAAVLEAVAAGQTQFGENYLQEALLKMQATPRTGLAWHFIGPVQSNKTRELAAHFDWVHALDRLKIAQRLSEQRPPGRPALNVCVQVNISGETSKSGCAPDQALPLCRAIAALPQLRLRGLMAIPEAATAGSDPRIAFHALQKLYSEIRQALPQLDTLSAGMSDDLEAAVAEGSTMVRVGTSVFGPRNHNK